MNEENTIQHPAIATKTPVGRHTGNTTTERHKGMPTTAQHQQITNNNRYNP